MDSSDQITWPGRPPPRNWPGTPGDSRVPGLIATTAIAFCVAPITVAGRFYVRGWILGSLGRDDWLILVALFFMVGGGAAGIYGTTVGFGKHVWQGKLDDVPKLRMLGVMLPTLYTCALCFLHLSILAFYTRLSLSRRTLKLALFLSYLTILANFSGIIANILHCLPKSLSERPAPGHMPGLPPPKIPHEGNQCTRFAVLWYTTASINMMIDFIIWVMPIPTLWGMRDMTTTQKMGIVFLFSFGMVAVAASVGRIQAVKESSAVGDESWDRASIHIISMVEIGLGIACACVPSSRPIWGRVARWWNGTNISAGFENRMNLRRELWGTEAARQDSGIMGGGEHLNSHVSVGGEGNRRAIALSDVPVKGILKSSPARSANPLVISPGKPATYAPGVNGKSGDGDLRDPAKNSAGNASSGPSNSANAKLGQTLIDIEELDGGDAERYVEAGLPQGATGHSSTGSEGDCSEIQPMARVRLNVHFSNIVTVSNGVEESQQPCPKSTQNSISGEGGQEFGLVLSRQPGKAPVYDVPDIPGVGILESPKSKPQTRINFVMPDIAGMGVLDGLPPPPAKNPSMKKPVFEMPDIEGLGVLDNVPPPPPITNGPRKIPVFNIPVTTQKVPSNMPPSPSRPPLSIIKPVQTRRMPIFEIAEVEGLGVLDSTTPTIPSKTPSTPPPPQSTAPTASPDGSRLMPILEVAETAGSGILDSHISTLPSTSISKTVEHKAPKDALSTTHNEDSVSNADPKPVQSAVATNDTPQIPPPITLPERGMPYNNARKFFEHLPATDIMSDTGRKIAGVNGGNTRQAISEFTPPDSLLTISASSSNSSMDSSASSSSTRDNPSHQPPSSSTQQKQPSFWPKSDPLNWLKTLTREYLNSKTNVRKANLTAPSGPSNPSTRPYASGGPRRGPLARQTPRSPWELLSTPSNSQDMFPDPEGFEDLDGDVVFGPYQANTDLDHDVASGDGQPEVLREVRVDGGAGISAQAESGGGTVGGGGGGGWRRGTSFSWNLGRREFDADAMELNWTDFSRVTI